MQPPHSWTDHNYEHSCTLLPLSLLLYTTMRLQPSSLKAALARQTAVSLTLLTSLQMLEALMEV